MLTEEQQALVHYPFKGKCSVVVVQAYAGTGKTSTLIELAKERREEKILYIAYNKSMAEEAKRKFKDIKNVHTQTIHSLAFKHIGKNYIDRLGNLSPLNIGEITKYFLSSSGNKTVSSILIQCFNKYLSSSHKNQQEFFEHYYKKYREMLSKYDIQPHKLFGALDALWRATSQGDTQFGDIPMPHDVYLKLFQIASYKLPFSTLLIDEAQDITDCMINIVCEQNAHKVFIGDSFQQIYAWNGAVDSLEKLHEQGADCLYLTKSFRCPDHVAELANQYLRLMGARKPFYGNGSKNSIAEHSCTAFIARSNASIFTEAYKTVEDGGTPYFLGGFAGYNFELLLDLSYAQCGKWNYVRDVNLKSNFKSFVEIEEYAECDQILLSRCNIVKKFGKHVISMYNRIKNTLTIDEKKATRVFSTAHKAKGAEWNSIELAGDFFNVQENVIREIKNGEIVTVNKEELNIIYVAITRSKHRIIIQNIFCIDNLAVKLFLMAIKTKNIIFEK